MRTVVFSGDAERAVVDDLVYGAVALFVIEDRGFDIQPAQPAHDEIQRTTVGDDDRRFVGCE